jgi:putative membrane protein
MRYLKSWLFNFLAVFFANYVLPGIEITSPTKLPHLGDDFLIAFVLGGLNTLVYPLLKLFRQSTSLFQVGLIILVLNFLAYGILKFLPLGVHPTSLEGYLLAAVVVSVVGFLTSYFERDPPVSNI